MTIKPGRESCQGCTKGVYECRVPLLIVTGVCECVPVTAGLYVWRGVAEILGPLTKSHLWQCNLQYIILLFILYIP